MFEKSLKSIGCLCLAFSILYFESIAQCGVAPLSGTFSTSAGINFLNSYYPGTGSPLQGATTLTVGPLDSRGSSVPLASGDLIVIMQMQGADINTTNTDSYGDGVALGNASGYLASNLYAGTYEYNVVSTIVGSNVTLQYTLSNNYYTQSYNGTLTKRAYQVIRVPRYYSLNLVASSTITAPEWNGVTGGVVVIEAANTLTFANSTSIITASGKGFRGGGGKQFTGATAGNSSGSAALVNTDFRFPSSFSNANNLTGGTKGEGIAGTPVFLPDPLTSTTVTGTLEGYIGGSMGRGAPGNAGGGGTDGAPVGAVQNQYNTGGGGGANYGSGGRGGSGWDGTGGNAAVYPFGGYGGASFSANSAISRLIMGGGGGSGTANNSTTATEYNTSGGAGGGIVIVRAKNFAGAGVVSADGNAALDITTAGQTDAAGGGGAGGTIYIATNASGATGLGTVTLSSKGGNGGSMTTYFSHGPGGGGGGGIIYSNGTPATNIVTGGSNGFTHTCCNTANPLTDAYNATSGSAGLFTLLTGISGFTNPNNALSPCGVLPIRLMSFSASVANKTEVHLRWTVDQAINFKGFEVLYSTDNRDFSPALNVNFISSLRTYEAIHIPPATGVVYYRLKLVDASGDFTYSNTLAVRLQPLNSTRISVYPNPAHATANIQIQANSSNTGVIHLFNSNGSELIRKTIRIIKGNNVISFPEITTLPAGVYNLRITAGSEIFEKEILKN
jgi:Secretion system C-terminal sorting domain